MQTEEIKKVKEPNEVIFMSTSAQLGLSIAHPTKVDKDNKPIKVKYNWVNGKLELNKISDKERLEILEKFLDDQWMVDEKGNYVLDDNENKVVKPGKMHIPVWKNDIFNSQVAVEAVRIKMDDNEFVEISPDKIKELIQNEKLKGKK